LQRNLEAKPHVAVTTGNTGRDGWDNGKDILVEGTAERVTDSGDLQALADAWYAKYGDDWKFEVRDQGFVEVSHSGGAIEEAPWVYRVRADKAIAFGDAHGRTKCQF
jgi:hypothetical protein